MKAIYLDCFSGISGNMLLGVFLQAGVPEAYLRAELAKLPLEGSYVMKVEPVMKNGIAACYVDVRLPHHDGEHGHEHRTMADIRALIEASALSEAVKARSLAIFQMLAEAEGKVHARPADTVAFHEVGAVDSILDIVGAAICLDYLGIERVFASKVNTGSGFVHCAHGLMPVPAPAVAELLLDWPSYHAGAEKELTTPTGAAFLRSQAAFSESLPEGFRAAGAAYGAGTWDLAIPNVLRLYIGQLDEAAENGQGTDFLVLETNIDDMSPQVYGYLYERLFTVGALDVHRHEEDAAGRDALRALPHGLEGCVRLRHPARDDEHRPARPQGGAAHRGGARDGARRDAVRRGRLQASLLARGARQQQAGVRGLLLIGAPRRCAAEAGGRGRATGPRRACLRWTARE